MFYNVWYFFYNRLFSLLDGLFSLLDGLSWGISLFCSFFVTQRNLCVRYLDGGWGAQWGESQTTYIYIYIYIHILRPSGPPQLVVWLAIRLIIGPTIGPIVLFVWAVHPQYYRLTVVDCPIEPVAHYFDCTRDSWVVGWNWDCRAVLFKHRWTISGCALMACHDTGRPKNGFSVVWDSLVNSSRKNGKSIFKIFFGIVKSSSDECKTLRVILI